MFVSYFEKCIEINALAAEGYLEKFYRKMGLGGGAGGAAASGENAKQNGGGETKRKKEGWLAPVRVHDLVHDVVHPKKITESQIDPSDS